MFFHYKNVILDHNVVMWCGQNKIIKIEKWFNFSKLIKQFRMDTIKNNWTNLKEEIAYKMMRYRRSADFFISLYDTWNSVMNPIFMFVFGSIFGGFCNVAIWNYSKANDYTGISFVGLIYLWVFSIIVLIYNKWIPEYFLIANIFKEADLDTKKIYKQMISFTRSDIVKGCKENLENNFIYMKGKSELVDLVTRFKLYNKDIIKIKNYY